MISLLGFDCVVDALLFGCLFIRCLFVFLVFSVCVCWVLMFDVYLVRGLLD